MADVFDFWREVLKVAFGRLEAHQTLLQRIGWLLLPIGLALAPTLVTEWLRLEWPVWLRVAPVLACVAVWAPAQVHS